MSQNFVFIHADTLSISLFTLFCVIMYLILLWAVRLSAPNTFKKFLFILSGYLIAFSAIVVSGLPLSYILPVVPLLFASVLFGAMVIAFSSLGGRLALSLSFAQLIGFQAFRFPLELILHHWAEIGTIPPTMTWTGQNYDVVAGVVALITIPFLNGNKATAWFSQILSFGLLLNVLRVVIMSSPLPFSWPLDRPILLFGYMPYALIGPLFVGAALTAHLITFRKLMGAGKPK